MKYRIWDKENNEYYEPINKAYRGELYLEIIGNINDKS